MSKEKQMTKEYRVSIYYKREIVHQANEYTVKAGDARIAATKGLKKFALSDSFTGPKYHTVPLLPGDGLSIIVTR